MFRLSFYIVFFALYSFSTPLFAIFDIPQTGQDVSYANNDDGELKLGTTIPKPRFTNNDDGTLTDNFTGLTWLRDSYCANHFISGASSQSWQDALNFIQALNNKTLISPCTEYDWQYDDWRLPNINELQSLIPKGLVNTESVLDWLLSPGGNSPGFVDATLAVNPVWSSTLVADNEELVWTIDLNTGEIQTANKLMSNGLGFIFGAVRGNSTDKVLSIGKEEIVQVKDIGEVKNGFKLPEVRFVDQLDGTIVDKLTGLNWLKDANCAIPGGSTWQAAINSVSSTLLDPSFFANCPIYIKPEKDKDWRIPNINELLSLVDYTKIAPSINDNINITLAFANPFWSSTSSNGKATTHAWAISLQEGIANPALAKTEIANVWPVRGPIKFPDLQTNIDTIEFNHQYTNDEPVQKEIEIENIGNDVLDINSIFIGEVNSQTASRHFSLGRDGCSGRLLDPGTTCTSILIFEPKSSGILQAKISILSNALGLEEASFTIEGTGLNKDDDSNPNCFIATAAYGSNLEPEVNTLRKFRDEYLLKSYLGRYLVETYYEISPPIANSIAQNENLRTLVRWILTPVVYSAKHPLFFALILLFLSLVKLRYNSLPKA